MDKSDECGPDEGPDRTELRLRTFALASMSKTTSFLFQEKQVSSFFFCEGGIAFKYQVINEMKKYSVFPVSPLMFTSKALFLLRG